MQWFVTYGVNGTGKLVRESHPRTIENVLASVSGLCVRTT